MQDTLNHNIYVDMDGTLAEWQWVGPDTFTKKGYYSSLPCNESMVEATKHLIKKGCNVYILSAVLNDNHSKDDKNKWLDKYLPEIPSENRIFVPYGDCKDDYVEHESGDVLVDDYNPNLDDWEGIPIKFVNSINNRSGEWKGFTISHTSSGETIANTIMALAEANITA